MPPRPISSMISSWGKAAATRSRDGISAVAVGACASGRAASASTHLGQRPCGASLGTGAPHLGQRLFAAIVSIAALFLRHAGAEVTKTNGNPQRRADLQNTEAGVM